MAVCIPSDNQCLPENFGSFALYYPPKDFTTLAKRFGMSSLWEKLKGQQWRVLLKISHQDSPGKSVHIRP